tara:strand:+ start:244 stop:498 length:255 start_codon:yes stop_codon:yes gene_type:complete
LTFIGAVLLDPDLAECEGFSVVVQAYRPRAEGIIDHLYELAKRHNRQITIRLVKGGYWDNEIKQAPSDAGYMRRSEPINIYWHT